MMLALWRSTTPKRFAEHIDEQSDEINARATAVDELKALVKT
jgi:hypothetical protein